MRMKILISRPVPEDMIKPYTDEFDVVLPEHPLSYEEVLEQIDQYDAFFAFGTKVDKAMLDKGCKLKAVANFGVGYDKFDVKYASEKGVAIVNTPTQVTDATAEHTVALIISAMRSIAKYDKELRRGVWTRVTILDGTASVSGSTLGILGFGRIGKSVCSKAHGLGMNVIYYDAFRASEDVEKEYGVTYMEFDEVLKNADCITIHMPYTPENHHLFNMETFKKMKPNSFFVNAARGPLVNEQDLYEALNTGVLRGAGLDVFEKEPTIYEPLKELENIVITPHAASATFKARHGMLVEAMDGIAGVLKGELPYNVVNQKDL